MKKTLGLLLSLILVFSGISGICAKKTDEIPVVVSDVAAYLSGDFYGHSMTIEGSLYSSNGNVKFDGSGSNLVKGNITLNSSKSYIEENVNSKPTIYGTVTKLDSTVFDFKTYNIINTPNIENKVDNFVADWYPTPENVTVNTHYKTLSIINRLKVDTSKGDIYIVADNLIMGTNSHIEIIGDGNLYLFVGNGLNVSGSSTINNGGNSNKVSVFITGNLKIDGNAKIYSNLYLKNTECRLEGSGTLYGNIISNCKTFYSQGGAKIYGTVYVPLADSIVSNSATINGKLIAKSLDIYGLGKITYNKDYANMIIPTSILKYLLNVDISLSEAGNVSPNNSEFNYGDIVTLNVTTNDGYEFVEFTSPTSGVLPDSNKNIKITKDTNLTAVFKKVEKPVEITTINDIPKGNRIYINFPYAYLYGYEQGNVGGEDDVKREEASALLYRLLKQDNQIGGFVAGLSTFTDVSDTRWSKNALMYMKHIGVYVRDYVNPHHAITRGEVAKIITFALRIQPDNSKTISFTDLSGDNPYYWYIKALSDIGIMKGFDGKVNPDANITRAEYVTILNRIIGRDNEYYVDDLKVIYPDLNDKSYWAYDDLMRASFGFTDNKIDGYYKVDPSRKPSREKVDYN